MFVELKLHICQRGEAGQSGQWPGLGGNARPQLEAEAGPGWDPLARTDEADPPAVNRGHN